MCAKCCRSVCDARDSTRVVRLRDQRGPDEDWLARRVRARKHLSLGKSYRWDARRAVPAWRLYLRSRSLDEQRRRGNGRMCHSSRTRHNNDRLETLTMPRGEYGRKGKKKKMVDNRLFRGSYLWAVIPTTDRVRSLPPFVGFVLRGTGCFGLPVASTRTPVARSLPPGLPSVNLQ